MNRGMRIVAGMLGLLLWATPAGAGGRVSKKQIEHVEDFLVSSRLLKSFEREELARLTEGLADEITDAERMRRLAVTAVAKTVKARGHFEFLLQDLDKLLGDPYARKAAGTKSKRLTSSRTALKNLRADMETARLRVRKAGPWDTVDYRKVFERHLDVVLGRSRKGGLPRMWETLDRECASWMVAWRERQADLLKKADTVEELEDILTADEVRFLKVFGRVDRVYALLKGELSQ